MQIRRAVEADVARMTEISNWAAANTPANFATEPEPVAQWLEAFRSTSEQYPWLVAEAGSPAKVIGFARGGPHKLRGAYRYTVELSVYVDPEHHGRGVGRALYARLFPLLEAQGYCTLVAGITTPNAASVRLHESFGLRHVATFERAGWKFGAWHNVCYWQRCFERDQPVERLRSVDEVMERVPVATA